MWLLGYWCFDWYEEAIQVKAIDVDKRQITLARPTVYGVKQGNPSPRRYRALNLLEELDQPGEFYLDRFRPALFLAARRAQRCRGSCCRRSNSPLVALRRRVACDAARDSSSRRPGRRHRGVGRQRQPDRGLRGPQHAPAGHSRHRRRRATASRAATSTTPARAALCWTAATARRSRRPATKR